MKKVGLAALAAMCLWTGVAVPVAAQGYPSPAWRMEQYDNGYKIYFCNGAVWWTNPDEEPGTLIDVTEDPTAC